MAVTIATYSGNIRKGGRRTAYDSTGRLWYFAYDYANTRATFWYSENDGATWTENTSMRVTVSSDTWGVFTINTVNDRAVFWSLGNTSAHFIDGITTSSSWTAVSGTSPGMTSYGVQDVVLFDDPDDSGNVYVAAIGYDPSYYVVWIRHVDMDTMSVIGSQQIIYIGYGLIGGGIDFHHTGDGSTVAGGTPHLYVTGTAAANYAYFTKLTYSSGTWTEGTNQVVGSYAAYTYHGFFPAFDGTYLVQPVADSGYNTLAVYQTHNSTETTTELTGIPSHTFGGTAANALIAIDPTTDDVALIMENSSNYPVYTVYDRSAGTWSSWTILEAESLSAQTLSSPRHVRSGGLLPVNWVTTGNDHRYEGIDFTLDASVSPGYATGVATAFEPADVDDGRIVVFQPAGASASAQALELSVSAPAGSEAPIIATPSELSLGCAEEYTVLLTARDLETYAAEMRWSALQWSRVLDEVSSASIVVPDVFQGVRCNIAFGSEIVPWRYGIRIERNGVEVWSGPITSISRPTRSGIGTDYVEVQAADAMAWMGKRVPTQDLVYSDVDAGTVFKGVLEDGTSLDNTFGLYCPDFVTGYTMTRDVLAYDFQYTLDILTELGDSAVDWFMIGKELAVYDYDQLGWYVIRNGVKTLLADTDDPFGRYVYGLFTNEAYVARPGFAIDGQAQGNNIYVPGTDSGEAGFRRYWTASDVNALDGLLTYVDINALYRPQEGTPITSVEVFQQRADSLLALRKVAPVVLSGGALSQDAPITMDGMFPGSVWGVDLAEMGVSQLLDAQRLKRVDVTVAVDRGSLIEQVSPTLMPLGSDESQAI